jgi:tRNA-splicing ligase RtcB
MHVPGLIYVNDNLLEQVKKDQAPDQVANVAFLPGIVGASIAMPDIHWGYGFCIGGVAATDPAEGGVICPGGIGYDINCLPGDARVLHAFGYHRRIDDAKCDWGSSALACFDLSQPAATSTPVAVWFGKPADKPVVTIRTKTGDELRATADHPVWTPRGMLTAGSIRPGDIVARCPFEGVEYELPSSDVLIDEASVRRRWSELGKGAGGNGLNQVIAFLKSRELLPLHYDSPAVPLLCGLLGFVLGDGTVRFSGRTGKGVAMFYARPADLEQIQIDVRKLGFTPSQIYRRERIHKISRPGYTREFRHTETVVHVVGSAFAMLLACLGAPIGNKARQDFDAPDWLERGPAWYRRLFLAAYFGAEMSAPKTVPGHGSVFAAPAVTLSKREPFGDSGQRFLEAISRWLADVGVETQALNRRSVVVNAAGDSATRFSLLIKSDTENLIRLWSRVGFLHNRSRSGRAALAVQYLKLKREQIARRTWIAGEAKRMRAEGVARSEIFAQLAGSEANIRFLERSIDAPRRTPPRVGSQFPLFAKFADAAGAGLADSGMVWDEVVDVLVDDQFDGLVYDVSVAHPDHNFVADGFVVSNCGVRLVRTNLGYRQVKNHIRSLVQTLFNTVPAGVGRGGKYKFNDKEMQPLLEQGASYVIGRGLGVPRDLAHIEANGRRAGPCFRSRGQAWQRAMRYARQRQPLHGSAGGRSRLRRGRGQSVWPGEGSNLRIDSLGLAGTRLPGLRRCVGRLPQCGRQAWHPVAGPTARVCSSG